MRLEECSPNSQDVIFGRSFRWLSVFACLGVVLIHSRTYQTLPNAAGGILFQSFVSNAIVRFAVPCFS